MAVVHCKAGKGRTGLMICAYLLHCGLKTTASEVLEYYAKQRTQDQKGVTIPSQKRYVDYYSTLITNSLQYNPVKMYLTSIVIDPLPNLGQGRQEGYIQVTDKIPIDYQRLNNLDCQFVVFLISLQLVLISCIFSSTSISSNLRL